MDGNFVSYCLITYNQEKFVKDALLSALNQTYDNMEIIISDDGSTDHTVDVINSIISEYKGNKTIKLNINKPNLGIRENVNKVLYELSSGDIILLAAGDDISVPERTEVYVKYFERFPEIVSISCMSEEVDKNLNKIESMNGWFSQHFTIFNIDDYLEHKDFLIYSGDSRGIRRCVINSFPPLKYPRAEDLFIFFRAMLIGASCYVRTPLVKRRHHDNNVSSNFVDAIAINNSNKQLNEDLTYALEQGYLPFIIEDKIRDKISNIKMRDQLYNTKPTFSLRTFIFRCFRKYLGLTR